MTQEETQGKIAILEPGYQGHRLIWARLIAEHEPGGTALLTTVETTTSIEAAEHLPSGLTVLPVHWRRASQWWDEALRISSGASTMVVLAGDEALPYLIVGRISAVLHGRAWPVTRVVLLRWWPADTRRSRVSVFVKRALARTALAARIADEIFVLSTVSSRRRARRMQRLQDPVSWSYPPPGEIEAMRSRLLGSGRNRKIALVAGALSGRKRVEEIVGAWKLLSDEYTLVLAGKPDEQIEAFLNRPEAQDLVDRGSLVVWPQYQSDKMVDLLVASADVVCLLYRNVGASALLLKAVLAETPVVSSGNPVVASMVETENLGIVVDACDDRSVAGAVVKACTMKCSAEGVRGDVENSAATFVNTLMGKLHQ